MRKLEQDLRRKALRIAAGKFGVPEEDFLAMDGELELTDDFLLEQYAIFLEMSEKELQTYIVIAFRALSQITRIDIGELILELLLARMVAVESIEEARGATVPETVDAKGKEILQ